MLYLCMHRFLALAKVIFQLSKSTVKRQYIPKRRDAQKEKVAHEPVKRE